MYGIKKKQTPSVNEANEDERAFKVKRKNVVEEKPQQSLARTEGIGTYRISIARDLYILTATSQQSIPSDQAHLSISE